MAEIYLGNSLVLMTLIMIPMAITLFPSIIGVLQDEFPDQVERGNPFFILFSPYLDRVGIRKDEDPKVIMERSVRKGTEGIADRMVSPVVGVLGGIQSSIATSLQAIREAIQQAIVVPTRSLYSMITGLTITLNSVTNSVLGAVAGLFSKIRMVLLELSGTALIGMNLQIVALNTMYSAVGFFMMLLKVLGAIIVALGIPLMFFFMPLAITFITLGSIMINISLNSEAVLPN